MARDFEEVSNRLFQTLDDWNEVLADTTLVPNGP